MKSLQVHIPRILNPLPLLALLVSFSGFYIAQRFNVSIERAQTIFFPFVLLSLWKLSQEKSFQLPTSFIVSALGCWALFGLHIRGYLPSFGGDQVVLSRIDEPSGADQGARELFRRYNTIARAYGAPKMDIITRRFESPTASQQWISERGRANMVLSGNLAWVDIAFSKNRPLLTGELTDLSHEGRVRSLLDEFDLELDRDRLAVVQPPGIPTVVVFGFLPSSLSLPTEPQELALHYLAWLSRSLGNPDARLSEFARGLEENEKGVSKENLRLAFYEDALSQMTKMLGAWHSPAPLSLARLMFGSFELADAIASVSANRQQILASATELNSAQKVLRKERYPELMSLIRNNFGIARVFVAESEEDIAKARKEFLGTSSLLADDGRPPVGARVALVNLLLLEEAGIL